MRGLLILMLFVLLSGCTPLATKSTINQETTEPSTAIKQAKALQKEMRWSEALLLLNKVINQYPEVLPLSDVRDEIQRDWEREKRNNEDWILVYETRELKQKIPYLERLATIDPANYITKSRLLFWKALLESKLAALIGCGTIHLNLDPSLAEACATLAEQIKPTEESKHLLANIRKTQIASKRAEQIKEAVRDKLDKTQQREQWLAKATKQRDDGAFQESINSLKKLLLLVPNDPEATKLLRQVTVVRDRRVEQLIKLGDALYRDEQIEQAVSVWESAEKLDVGRADIGSRIDRAMKVLAKLREIKEVE